MHKTLRSRIFLASLICFIIGAPLIIFWAKGYRFDYEKRAVTRTGGIFVNTRGVDADLEISGVIGSRTISHSIFSSGVLINNLLPKPYTVYVKKDGYITWSKILEVKPLEVSRESHIMLLPEVPLVTPVSATGSTAGIWNLTEDNEAILGIISNGELTMRLVTLSADMSKIGAAPTIFTLPAAILGGNKIVSVSISRDHTNALIELENGTVLLYRGSAKKTVTFNAYLRAISASGLPQLNLMWHPTNGSRLLGLSQNGRIYNFDLEKNIYERVDAATKAIAMDRKNKYILLQNGDIIRPSDKGFDKITAISLPPSLQSSAQLNLVSLTSRSYIIQSPAGETWLLMADKNPQLIARKINFVMPNQDGTRVAIFSADQIISVLFINGISDDIYLAPASQIKLGLAGQDLKDIYWLDDNWHLALRYPDKFEIIEIDNRSPINRVVYPITNEGAILGSSGDTIIYVSRGSLWGLSVSPIAGRGALF